jgi:hypothetical protein
MIIGLPAPLAAMNDFLVRCDRWIHGFHRIVAGGNEAFTARPHHGEERGAASHLDEYMITVIADRAGS